MEEAHKVLRVTATKRDLAWMEAAKAEDRCHVAEADLRALQD